VIKHPGVIRGKGYDDSWAYGTPPKFPTLCTGWPIQKAQKELSSQHVHAQTGTLDKMKDCVRTSSRRQRQQTTQMNNPSLLELYVLFAFCFSQACWFGSFPWPSCPHTYVDGTIYTLAIISINDPPLTSHNVRTLTPLVPVVWFGQIFRLHHHHLWKAS
jgi:hypothetical protein